MRRILFKDLATGDIIVAKKRVDTSVMFERLRRKAASKGFVVFEIYVRNAGIGIAYTKVQGRKPEPGEVTVFAYKKNLRAAIEYELKMWDEWQTRTR